MVGLDTAFGGISIAIDEKTGDAAMAFRVVMRGVVLRYNLRSAVTRLRESAPTKTEITREFSDITFLFTFYFLRGSE